MTLNFALCLALVLIAESLAQQVTTPDGPVNGIAQTTYSGTNYYAYYTIPYAKPPTGSLRFLPPEPADPWTTPHDGTVENPNICYNVYSDYEQENEDCLHINVFTPQDPSQALEKRPVLVSIHGGGFITGSGLESSAAIGGMSPKYFIDEGLVFVSFNYRLGLFGFISTGDEVLPGNAGLRDQILALKWIQRNIASFGGDPDLVTITGTSAGAASNGYLVLSPAAKGLFSAAIMESGTPLCPWAYQRNATEVAFKAASLIDSQFESSTDSKKLLEVLQQVDAKTLDTTQTDYCNWDSSQPDAVYRLSLQQGFRYAPVIEASGSTSDPVVSGYQYETLSSGSINKVPVLLGMTSEEGLANYDQYVDYILGSYDSTPGFLVPQDLHELGEQTWNEVGNLIKQEYSPSDTFVNNKLGGIQYFTEQDFAKGITKYAEILSQYTDVFFYQFAYSGGLGWNTEHKYPGSGNVSHAEEWGYLYFGYPVDSYSQDDQLVHKRMVRLWSNFVKYHNPTPTSEELLEGIIWPKVTSGNFQYLNIGNFADPQLTLGTGKPKAERMAFWDSIYEKYGQKPFDTY